MESNTNKTLVGIVDYDVGNLFSVENAFRKLRCDFITSSNPEQLQNVDRIVLPGVGSFNDGMKKLKALQLDKFLVDFANSGKPLLGICLGMQLLFDIGVEGGETKGLGLINGQLVKLNPDRNCRVPHIGWNDIYSEKLNEIPIFAGIPQNAAFYFVHSYHAMQCSNTKIVYTDFCGNDVVAAVQNKNLYGVQFHPEKSQKYGIQLLSNFLEL